MAFSTVADERDRIAVKQIVTASVVKQHAEDIANLCGARFRQRQPPEPRLHANRFDFVELVFSPVWRDPIVQITFMPTFG